MLFIPTLFMSLLISADGVSAELVSSNTLPACCAFPGFTPLDEHVTFRGFLRCFLIPKKKKKKAEKRTGKGSARRTNRFSARRNAPGISRFLAGSSAWSLGYRALVENKTHERQRHRDS